MAEHPPDQLGAGGPPNAPSAYGARSGESAPVPPPPTNAPPALPPDVPLGTGPVYGRVHRYGHGPVDPRSIVGGPPVPTPPAILPAAWPPPAAGLVPPPGAGPQPPYVLGGGAWVARPPRNDYASWWRRVAGSVVDAGPMWVAAIVLIAGYIPLYAGLLRGDLRALPHYRLVLVGTLLYVGAFAFDVWNRWFLAGRTGQSIGKRVAKTWLVGQQSGRPVGVLAAFVRDLLHVLDGMSYVGYLWPLWDEERQTLADKVVHTVVVRTRVEPLGKGEPTQLVA